MNRLVLIDGNAILHRAYHALPPLTALDGSIVNAVYGFTSVLIKLWNDFKPTHMAVAFDRPAPTFRKKLFLDYQAKRPKMEEALISQIDKIHDVVTSFGIPIYEKDGFEADDVIGTIAKKAISYQPSAVSLLDEIIIVTGDRDLLQLVDDHINVFMPVKGLSEGKVFDETSATEKFGVAPKQIPDYKGLAGDTSDNYPGVAGIGPKTAADLIGEYGSIDALYEKLSAVSCQLSAGIREKLLAGKESALLSKDLATIRTDAPIDVSFEKMKIATLATPQSRMKLAEFGFKTLLKRMNGESEVKKPEKPVKIQKSSDQEQLSLV